MKFFIMVNKRELTHYMLTSDDAKLNCIAGGATDQY